MYPLFFFIYVMVFIIAALIICLFQEVHYVLIKWYIFNIVWRYTYSIRLFLIEAKHTYKRYKYKQKTYSENIASSKVTLYTQGFFLRHRAIKLSLDPLLGYQREERLNFLNRQRHCYFVVDAKMCVCLNRSCVRSFTGCADLNLAGRAIEEGLVVASSVTQ